MNSETSTRYGSRVRRHGNSRAARAHQANKRWVKLNFCARRILTPCPPFESSPPVPLSALLSSPSSPTRTFVLTPCPPLRNAERGDEELTVRSPSPFGRGGTRNSPFVPPLHVVERGSGGEDHDAERGTRGEDHDAERGIRLREWATGGEDHEAERGTRG